MKKFLSMVLTLALVLSLIPAVFAAGESEEVVVTYSFTNSLIVNDGFDPETLTYKNTDGTWAYAANSRGLTTISDDTTTSKYILVNKQKFRIYPAYWIAFKIQVPASGRYDVSVNATLGTPATASENTIQAFLFKASDASGDNEKAKVQSGMKADNLLTSDAFSVVGDPGESLELGTEDFVEGEYYFVFRPAHNGTSTKKYVYLNSLTLTKNTTAPEPEKTDLEIAFELDGKNDNYTYIAPSVTGLDITGDVITPVDNENGTYTLEAPETDEDGNPFLYWAKGLDTKKRIISFDRIIKDYVPTEDGKNYLIAVYESNVENAPNEYYNQNGQLIGTGTQPALPSMAGYGAADEWVQCGTTNIWVAKYGEKTQPDNVTVTVNGEERIVPYGKDVPCEATGDNFKCWTKQGENETTAEIVSVDKNYTFKAWEDCTVTAVYADHTKLSSPMKIFIDSFTAGNETGIMAEFIGITGAVEKGIMWNDVKIPMTNPGNQFTVIADKNGTYKGYAILENDTGYTLITDGSITISNKAD